MLAPPGCHQCPIGGLPGRERAVAEAPRAQDACPPSAPQPRPEPLTCPRDRAAGRGEAAAEAGRARVAGWAGSSPGRAGSSPLKSWTWRSASRPARKCGFGQKGKRRGKKRTMCFLLGTRKPGLGFYFWCRLIILRCSLIPDKPALVAGPRGLLRIPTDAGGQPRRPGRRVPCGGSTVGGGPGSPR